MSMMVSFCAVLFPTRCLGWDLELNWVSFWGFSFLLLPYAIIIWSEVIYLDASRNRSWDQFLEVSWLALLFNETITVASGAPVAQWVKRWPTDLAVPSSIPARGEIFSTVNGVPLHTAFHYHLPIVLIWLKYCWKGRKIASHPSIYNSCIRQDRLHETRELIFHLLQDNLSHDLISFGYGCKHVNVIYIAYLLRLEAILPVTRISTP